VNPAIGIILLINVFWSFRPGISLGGHLGGLAGGLLCAWILSVTESGSLRERRLGLAGCIAVAVVSALGAVVASGAESLYT
jgi:membrane associated rhomboid family serine protease